MRRLESVIWYPEAISYYESELAIVNRFCRLNLVSTHEFWRFIRSPRIPKCVSPERRRPSDPVPGWPRDPESRVAAPVPSVRSDWIALAREWPSILASNQDLQMDGPIPMAKVGRVLRLGTKLDWSDPESYVPSLRGQRNISSARFGRDGRDDDWYQRVFDELCGEVRCAFRACGKCLNAGYHSLAHQVPWLDRCLIHGDQLSANCPSCGRPFLGREPQISRCPDCALTAWFGRAPKFLTPPFSKQQLRPIRRYIDWMASWESDPRLNSMWWNVNHSKRLRTGFLADAVARLGPRLDMPRAIKECWSRTDDSANLYRVFPMPADKAHALEKAAALFGPDELADAISERGVLVANPVEYDPALKSILRKIRRRHHLCSQMTARALRAAGAFAPRLQLLSQALCVSARCTELIREEWWGSRRRRPFWRGSSYRRLQAYSHPNGNQDLKNFLKCYGLLIEVHAGGGVRRGLGVADSNRQNLIVDPALRTVVNYLFCEQIIAIVAHYREQFAAVEAEPSLDKRASLLAELDVDDGDHAEPPVFLFRILPGALIVWGWRRTRRRAVSDDDGLRHRKWVTRFGRALQEIAFRVHEKEMKEFEKTLEMFGERLARGGGPSQKRKPKRRRLPLY